MIYVESPTNPGLEILDLPMIATLAKAHQIIFNVDNCFATPAGQQPMALGADLVILGGSRRKLLVNLLRGDTVQQVSHSLPEEIRLVVVG
jgi:hypothetical protein